MAWEVRLKPEWPNDSFRRDGIVFTKDKPVILDGISDTIKNEQAFVKTEIGAEKKRKEENAEAKPKAKGKRNK